MAVVAFGDRTALEARITADRVVQIFDFDGDGLVTGADETRLDQTIADANDVVAGILLGKGFSLAQLETLKDDNQIKRAWSCICAQLAGEVRTEWYDDEGKGPYDALGQRARAELKALTRGELRSRLETDPDGNAGVNAAIRADCSTASPVFIFNRNPNNPNDTHGPGGF